MTPPSFEFCAFSFLTQWQESECALHSAISTVPDAENIRKALNYFQVARTFKGLNEPGKVDVILDRLIAVRDDSTLESPHEKVDRLASELRFTFGKVNVSAASKLLWLTFRDPFIIYDKRAVDALSRHFHHSFASYEQYLQAWREEYLKSEAAIRAAVKELPKARLFMRLSQAPDPELLRMAHETWFVERVFDIFLWEVGAKDSRR
jgi:hypothetical protein